MPRRQRLEERNRHTKQPEATTTTLDSTKIAQRKRQRGGKTELDGEWQTETHAQAGLKPPSQTHFSRGLSVNAAQRGRKTVETSPVERVHTHPHTHTHRGGNPHSPLSPPPFSFSTLLYRKPCWTSQSQPPHTRGPPQGRCCTALHCHA